MEMRSSVSNEQTDDVEVMKKMQDDHLRLQRQFRMIQADRTNRIMGVHPLFKNQDNLLKRLKKEYKNVSTDLKIAKSGANRKMEDKKKKDVLQAILLREKTDTECENGIVLMDQLEGLLLRNHKETLHLKHLVNSSMGQLEERRFTSEMRLMATENKLETAMLRFNMIQSENKKIRAEIEHLLKDRAIFNLAWDKMLNVLSKGKKFLTDLFESSTLAYDQRDEWCTKLKSVQEKGRMDQLLQVQEMRDLQKSLDHEMKLYNFLSKKGIIRINKKEEKRMEEQKNEKEKHLKEEYNTHVKILEDINNYTEELDVSKIIETFQRNEQNNFSTYKMLTKYCAENEVLARDLKHVRQNLEDRKDWIEMMEEKKNNRLKLLRAELEKRTTNVQNLRQKLEMRTRKLNDAMEKMGEIFKTLDCSLEPFHNLLGDKRPSFHCLNLTFCLITEKIKELIQTAFYYLVFPVWSLWYNGIHEKTIYVLNLHQERHVQKRQGTSRLKHYTVHAAPPKFWTAIPINYLVPADPCPSCIEARWMSRVPEKPEVPLEEEEVVSAIKELAADPAFVRSDRIHALTECRVPRSRVILARRYMQN